MAGPRIAFLGTSIMGAPMARNIATGGFDVTVWNRTRAKAERLSDVATVADTAAGAVAEADIVITMLENGGAVTDVLLGSQRAVAAAEPGTLFIDMSSIQPALARDHAAAIEGAGCRALDAPVSGGEAGAIAASLAIMAGGAAADTDAAAAVLAAMGRVTHVGVHGAGQVAKLANQCIVAISIGAVAEALLLAEKGGCDPASVRAALMGGFATSRILELHGERMTKRDWVPGGPLRMQLKDLDNALTVARENGLSLPLTEQARVSFADLAGPMEMGEFDHSAYLLWLEAQSPGVRLGDLPDSTPG